MSGALSHNRLQLPASTSAFDLPPSSAPSPLDPDDDSGLSPFMLHQRRRPSLLNPKLGHLSLDKRHRSPLSSSLKLRSSRRRKSTSTGEDSESDRDSNKMWISDRSASTSSDSSRNATPPQQPESTLSVATATGATFGGLGPKSVGDMAGARPSTPPRTPSGSGFDGMDVAPRRRLSLPVRLYALSPSISHTAHLFHTLIVTDQVPPRAQPPVRITPGRQRSQVRGPVSETSRFVYRQPPHSQDPTCAF